MKDSLHSDAILVNSSTPDSVENDAQLQLASPWILPLITPSNNPPFKEFIAHILSSTEKICRPHLPPPPQVPPILYINHNYVDRVYISTQLFDACPTPLAKRYSDQDSNNKPNNFPPLSFGYTSSDWLDDVLVPVHTTLYDRSEHQLCLSSTLRSVLPWVAIKKKTKLASLDLVAQCSI